MPGIENSSTRSRVGADLCGHCRITFFDELLHSLSDFNNAVHGHVLKGLDAAGRRPAADELVSFLVAIKPKVLAQSPLRPIAVAKHNAPRLLTSAGVGGAAPAHCIAV